MRERHKLAVFALCLLLFLCSHTGVHGETTLQVYGVGAIEEDNLAKAEQLALKDAFSKAIVLVALRHVPYSSSLDLMEVMPDFMASRGMQDIIQYQITSRSQQYDILAISVDIKLDEESIKDWLYAHTLTVPYDLRPGILLMISSYGPGDDELYEWWTMKGRKVYSSFETQLKDRFTELGEKVLDVPQRLSGVRFDITKPIEIAQAAGADILITGTISYTPVLDTLYECSMEISLIDPQTLSPIGTFSVSRRGDFSPSTMNSLMIDEVIKPIRARIAHKMLSISPVVVKKNLCIEGIEDYVTYQTFINAISSMESISAVEINSIQGHSICHTLQLKGSLLDVMENLKREQIKEADIVVEDDTAYIRIINN
ncbi:MAG TPA: hypothetical protein PLV78_00150 [Deltaproteobacteria bacterium]|nr:hypothetical protein [Deltaproteobacteria bacterium]